MQSVPAAQAGLAIQASQAERKRVRVAVRKWYNTGREDMCMMDEIRAKRDEIYAIARRHKAEKLWAFGSCARGEERLDSDLDLLVKFNGDIGLLEYSTFERELSKELGRRVELTRNTVLRREPRFAARVCKEAVAI